MQICLHCIVHSVNHNRFAIWVKSLLRLYDNMISSDGGVEWFETTVSTWLLWCQQGNLSLCHYKCSCFCCDHHSILKWCVYSIMMVLKSHMYLLMAKNFDIICYSWLPEVCDQDLCDQDVCDPDVYDHTKIRHL